MKARSQKDDWVPPDSFDEYRILRRLGRGGQGDVYLAHDELLDRHVAVKFIAALDPTSSERARFIVEARAAARLQHPNVVTIYRVGEIDGRPFIVAEFVRGTSLNKIDKPVPEARALELAIGLSRGLAAAHRRGVLHRDIKPANAIIAEDGEVKLLDFGIAKLVGDPSESLADDTALSSKPLFHARSAADSGASTLTTVLEAPPPPVASSEPPCAPAPPSTPPPSTNSGVTSSRRGVSEVLRSLAQSSDQGQLTGAGSRMGTPRYLPPEIWSGEDATRRSDVYSLGALLYELLVGQPPHREVPTKELARVVQARRAPKVRDGAPSVDRAFCAVIDRCLALDPKERYASGEELREALEQLGAERATPGAGDVKKGNPYRGLMAFEAEHRRLFFGRSREISTIVERLRTEPFLLVAGDSGVGKSSICRAGVLPMILDGALGGGHTWSAVSLVPGRHPLAALAAALARGKRAEEEGLLTKIRDEPGELGRALRLREGAAGIVIFIDQLEELVTQSEPAEVGSVCEAIGHLAAGVPGVRVLATVRGDFLTRVAALPEVGDEVARALFLLRPLTPEGIRDAIVGPAQARGVAFESEELVETLVESTARAEGSLPLLQFALAELWAARERGQGDITAKALDAIGGVTGALTRHADHVMMTLLPRQRGVAKRVLTALVTTEGTRARRSAEELGAETAVVLEALDALVRGRLIGARDTELGTTYEVAHEALIRDWAALRGWLEEEAESRAARGRLSVAAAEWARLGRAREALWSARQLAEVEMLDAASLTEHERAFVAASRRAARRARLRVAGIPLLLLLGGGVVYGVNAVHARRELGARVEAHVDQARRLLTEARSSNQRVDALRDEAMRAFDARKTEAAERAWADALALAPKADAAYSNAGQSFEAALALDGSRAELAGALADVLYERAVIADRDHRFDNRDELLRRLAIHDAGGERSKRWNAAGHLRITTMPGGARVSLQPYVTDERLRRNLGPSREIGTSPIDELTVDPGSYLLVLTAPERVSVRLPIVVGRDEHLALEVALLQPAQVPEGFVYVPKGRFLCGGADEFLRRNFYSTVPLHQVETDAFLIARNETTIAEWIEFLQTLPPEERERRSPKVVSGGIANGSISLEEQRDGTWQLVLQPATQRYVAKTGEPVRYAKRDHNAIQTWMRFPVMGISSDDAVTYAAWLDRSGRVPGARLCLETEWERAARGADDREYPHGDRLEPDDADFDLTYGKDPLGFGPDEVGSHPASTSPFGLADMSGNVFEWTRAAIGDAQVAVRGGSYMFEQATNRIPNRQLPDASFRDFTLGMRVCATVGRTASR